MRVQLQFRTVRYGTGTGSPVERVVVGARGALLRARAMVALSVDAFAPIVPALSALIPRGTWCAGRVSNAAHRACAHGARWHCEHGDILHAVHGVLRSSGFVAVVCSGFRVFADGMKCRVDGICMQCSSLCVSVFISRVRSSSSFQA